LFSGFHGRTSQDDPPDFFVLPGTDCQCDGSIGLSGSGRTFGKDQIVFLIASDKQFLISGAGLNKTAIIPVYQDIIRFPGIFLSSLDGTPQDG